MSSLADVVNDLAGYLEYRREEGDRFVEVSPETLDALRRTVTAPGTPPARQMGPGSDSGAGRPGPARATPGRDRPAGAVTAQETAAASARLREIAATVAVCRKCDLHKTRTNTVPGQGNPRPEIAFIGEAPGADEDAQGLAFVGAAGQLLTRMIQAMGLTREEVFIGNILKCRPPNNRKPEPQEMATCLPYLQEQLAVLKPRVIVALGATAVEGLVNLTGITKLRGKWLSFNGIDLMPTYHPAYLLRNPPAKKDVWEDLKAVLVRLGRPIPPVPPGKPQG